MAKKQKLEKKYPVSAKQKKELDKSLFKHDIDYDLGQGYSPETENRLNMIRNRGVEKGQKLEKKFFSGNMSEAYFNAKSQKSGVKTEREIDKLFGRKSAKTNVLKTPNPVIKKKDTRSSTVKTKAPTLAKRKK